MAVAEKEHKMPVEFGPPSIEKPTDELLGELLLPIFRPGMRDSAVWRQEDCRLEALKLEDGHRNPEGGKLREWGMGWSEMIEEKLKGPHANTT